MQAGPKQPGAPKVTRSIGSGPKLDAVLLNPIRAIASAGAGRLPNVIVEVVPKRGGAEAVFDGTPAVPAQPAPKTVYDAGTPLSCSSAHDGSQAIVPWRPFRAQSSYLNDRLTRAR